jgi:ADP-ribosyl-[dinitrogen reductase] hydrolase
MGAKLEFKSGLYQEDVDSAMAMEGGGPFDTGPGQITDDSELALCLAHGLAEGNGDLDINKIVQHYFNWMKSPPFDIGNTTKCALIRSGQGPAEVRRSARKNNMGSQSNGSLMRITPLAIWARKLHKFALTEAVAEEVSLTHPDLNLQELSTSYCLAIQHLISGHERQAVYLKVKIWLQNRMLKDWTSFFWHIDHKCGLNTQINMGDCKIAFTYAFISLTKGYGFEKAMEDIISRGGDTDTNAAIVGGLIGAAVGYKAIPDKFKKKLFAWRPELGGIERPDFLIPGKVLKSLIDKIIEIAPTEYVKIIGGKTEEEKAVDKAAYKSLYMNFF